jgi:hypothetical protein
VPATATSAALIAAVNCVELTKPVLRALPFHRTVLVAPKPVPLTVKVKPGHPAVAQFGLSEEMKSTGLLNVTLRDRDA